MIRERLPFQLLDNYAGLTPTDNDQGNAGIDLSAGLSSNGDWVIPVGGERTIDTGLAVVIPEGYYGRVVLRSGHGFKRGLSCHIGTVDATYRGEIKVLVRNHSQEVQRIQPGERFAQLIVQPYVICEVEQVFGDIAEAYPSDRGTKGFGSSGL